MVGLVVLRVPGVVVPLQRVTRQRRVVGLSGRVARKFPVKVGPVGSVVLRGLAVVGLPQWATWRGAVGPLGLAVRGVPAMVGPVGLVVLRGLGVAGPP